MTSFIKKHLVKSKCLYFTSFGVIGSAFIYQTPLMYEFGVTASEIAVMNFFANMASFVGKVFMGHIADKYQIFREIMVINALVYAVLSIAQLAVPKQLINLEKEYFLLNGWKDNVTKFLICKNNSSTASCWSHQCHNNSIPIVFNLSEIFLTNISCSNYSLFSFYPNMTTCPNVPSNCQQRGLTWSLTFWLFFAIRMIIIPMFSFIFGLIDSVTFAALGRERSHEYGFTRMFASFGMLTMSSFTGFVLWLIGGKEHQTHRWIQSMMSISQYTPTVIISLLLLILLIAVALTLKKENRTEEKSVSKPFKGIILNKHVFLFLIFVVVGGFVYGNYIEYQVFIILQRYQNLPKFFPGMSISVMVISEMIFVAISPYFFKLLSDEAWISFTFFIWSIKWLGYVFAFNFWLLIPLDFLHGMSYGLMITCMMAHINTFADPSNLAKLQCLISGLFFNIGVSLGAIYGGFILDTNGYSFLYTSMSILTLICGVVYYPLQKWIIPMFHESEPIHHDNVIRENKMLLMEKVEVNV